MKRADERLLAKALMIVLDDTQFILEEMRVHREKWHLDPCAPRLKRVAELKKELGPASEFWGLVGVSRDE